MNFSTGYEPAAIKSESADSVVVQPELQIEENQLDGIVQEALQSLIGWSTDQDDRGKCDNVHDITTGDSQSLLDVQTSTVRECSEPVGANYIDCSATIPQEVSYAQQYNNHPWLTDWNGMMHAHEIPNFIPIYENSYVPYSPCTAVTSSSSTQGKRKRKRTAYTTDQLLALEGEFKVTKYVNRTRRAEIARALNLPDLNVKVWFQNRRMKDKREGQKYSFQM